MPDQVGQMFYFGGRPWHGKGICLERPATAEEALKFGGLEWEVELVPIVTTDGTPIKRRVAVVRKDLPRGDPSRILGVVYPGFIPLQNRDAVKLFDQLVGQGKPVYHTGGYLGNGEVIWLLAELPEKFHIFVRDDDLVEPFMLFTNSHDGTIAVDIRLTTIRVVCWNTLKMALREKQAPLIFKRWHKGHYETIPIEVEQFLQRETEAIRRQFMAMARTPFSETQFLRFLSELLPLPRPPVKQTERARKLYENRVAEVKELRNQIAQVFVSGINGNGVQMKPEETVWGSLNAVTGFVDHLQNFKRGDRFAHIFFGKGNAIKRRAYELLSKETQRLQTHA